MKLNIKPFICVPLVLLGLSGAPQAWGQTPKPEQRVNIGYTSQSGLEMAGAISTVSGEELEKSPVPNLNQTFTGRLAGLITMEAGGAPGTDWLTSIVRSVSTVNGVVPLIILDGVICSEESVNFITPHEVESVSVLKDASLTAIYGLESASGAIVITTKRGRDDGQMKVRVTYDQSFMQLTRTPTFISSSEYARMANQAWANDGAVGTQPFSQSAIDKYADGSDLRRYPNNNYYDMMFKPWAPMERVGITASSGNQRVRMFTAVNFQHIGSQYKNDQATYQLDEQTYDPKIGSSTRVNLRSNIDFSITKELSGFIRMGANVGKENGAGGYWDNTSGTTVLSNLDAVYGSLFYLPSTLPGPYTTITPDPLDPSRFLGGQVITSSPDLVPNPAYGLINRSGYSKTTRTNIMAQTGINLDMGFLTQGLSLGGVFGFETNSYGTQLYNKGYELWLDDNTQTAQGTRNNTFVSPSGHNASNKFGGFKSSGFANRLSATVKVDYNRTFNGHQVSGMLYGYYQNYDPNRYDNVYALRYNRVSSGASVSWGYNDRYFAKADVGYSGSDQFAKENRFVFTPSLALAWVASNEEFLRGVSWIDYLKVRASAGQVANDQLGGGRFMYADNIVQGGSPYIVSNSYSLYEYRKGNPDLAPEKVLKINAGVDMQLFRDLNLTVDYFRTHTDNMLVNAGGVIPAFTGVTSLAPARNDGEMKSHGIEVALGYHKRLNADWSIMAAANLLWSENEVISADEVPMGEGYAYQYRLQGYPVGQNFGYQIDRSQGGGYFTSQAEIDQVYYAFGTPRIGDFRYKNINGDKTSDGKDIIDEKDMAPIGYSWIPKVSYGITLGAQWKSISLSCMIQGTGYSSRPYQSAFGVNESLYGGIFASIHRDAWTPERAASGAKISYPALSQGTTTSRQNNDFFIMNTAYVRVKNVELAYNFPESIVKKIGSDQLRVYFSAQNLFTWDWLETGEIDPEVSSLDIYQNYRTFNLGVKLSF